MSLYKASASLSPSNNAPYEIGREWCMGDSLGYINANTSYFDTQYTGITGQIADLNARVNSLSAGALNFFRATESYPITYTDTDMLVTTQYVNQTGNPTANSTTLLGNPTNIWRRLNTVEYNYGNFAAVKQVGGSANGTYVELSAGLYEIRAGATLHACEAHSAALLKFTPGVATYTGIANGTVQYSEWAGDNDSNTSNVYGRFYFPDITGIALMHAFHNSKTVARVGSRSFPHIATPPTWLQNLMPNVVTAWIDIIKIY